MTQPTPWPPLPPVSASDPQAEVKKILYQAEVEVVKTEMLAKVERQKAVHSARLERTKATYEAQFERDKAQQAADLDRQKAQQAGHIERGKADSASHETQLQAVYTAFIEVAKGEIERPTKKAEFLQAAATAIGGVYTGILAFTFAAKDAPLPARGVVPTAFFGLTIALAAAYVSFVMKGDALRFDTTGLPWQQRQRERNLFIRWVTERALVRAYLLHGAVASLCLGAFLLPLPYVDIADNTAFGLAFAGALIVLAVILLSYRAQKDTA